MSKTEQSQIWRVPLAVEHVPPDGRHHVLVADEPTRAAIAKLANVPSIERIEANFDAHPVRGDGLHLTGEVTATVTQNCIVSLEPMQSEIAEPVDITFIPPRTIAEGPAEKGAAASVPVEVTDDAPEPLIGGIVDLGALATEFVLLGIDPYPRKPDAVFTPPVEPEAANPFAVLAALKKGSSEG
jgi:uncharacterized metal-binding protein YceD (DUF177 family)